MNEVHFHLVVNHFPIIFPIAGVIIMITGFILNSNAVKQTALMIFIIASLTAIAAMVSGEKAEDMVEKMNEVSKQLIERHEKSAEIFSWLIYILGGLSLFGIWANNKQKSISKIVSAIILIFAIGVIYFGNHTGATGGEIRHYEIRTEVQAPKKDSMIETDHDD